MRKDVTALQRACPGTSRKKQETLCALGTINQHRQEVKSMKKMSQEEKRRSVSPSADRRARIFYILLMEMVRWRRRD